MNKKSLLLYCSKILFFFLFISLFHNEIFASKWAILPARMIGVKPSHVKKGPHLFPTKSINAWEMTKVFSLYLKITGMNDIIPPKYIESAFKKARLHPNKKLTQSHLNQLGILLDADQLLISTIIKTQKGFKIQSKVFYTSSQSITDKIVSTHSNFWLAISRHLQKRFPYNKLPVSLKSRSKRPILFLLDASGSNYNEIHKMRKLISKIDTLYSGACAINGNQELSSSNIARHPQSILTFFKHLSVRGGSLYLKNFEKAIQCIQNKNPFQGDINDKPYIITLVSSMPETDNEKLIIKSRMRALASKSDILILGSGNLSNDARNFWQNIASELKFISNSQYKDIIYRQKIGLSNGEEWYLYKKGFTLIESQSPYFSNKQSGIDIPIHLRKKFVTRKILETYKRISSNKIVSSSKVTILIKKRILSFLKQDSIKSSNRQILRVLIKINKKPFWINIPKSVAYNKHGILKIKRNEKYYFLLQLLDIKRNNLAGIPFSNAKNFAMFFKTRRNIPRGMILNIDDYFMHPSKYINQSIAGTSLYFILGKVEIIRFPQSDVYEE